MKIELEQVLPAEIERRSMEIISEALRERGDLLAQDEEPVIKRVIHTTADFDYVKNLHFSEGAVRQAREAIRRGACIVTDTRMARAGINKKRLAQFGGEVFCFMSDPDVAEAALRRATTRAVASMDKAAGLDRETIFAVGNAPTALARLYELIVEGKISPALVIGVPVGFVNVVESKELFLQEEPKLRGIPRIIAAGRKGGSNVAAAIVNALIYGMEEKDQ